MEWFRFSQVKPEELAIYHEDDGRSLRTTKYPTTFTFDENRGTELVSIKNSTFSIETLRAQVWVTDPTRIYLYSKIFY